MSVRDAVGAGKNSAIEISSQKQNSVLPFPNRRNRLAHGMVPLGVRSLSGAYECAAWRPRAPNRAAARRCGAPGERPAAPPPGISNATS